MKKVDNLQAEKRAIKMELESIRSTQPENVKCWQHFLSTNKWSLVSIWSLSRFSTWLICSREQAKSECDWLVMTSVFVASQSSCFFVCSREQIRQVENRLNSRD